jgi:polysaccharide deacetylase 2 family uncharacterized protein YibQ
MGNWPSRMFTLAQGPGLMPDGTPTIAVVIDDLVGNVARTTQAIVLPANVTLSFLPDSPRSQELSRRAHQAGNESHRASADAAFGQGELRKACT